MKLRKITFFVFTSLVFSHGITSCNQGKRVADKGIMEVESYLQSLVDTGGIPGIAIAIADSNGLIYSNAFGVTNIETKKKIQPFHTFHAASISKTFTTTAIMQLHERGKIDINNTVVTYLPYFRMDDDRFKLITIKQILNHTSGMADVENYEWEKNLTEDSAVEKFVRSLANQRLISDPGKEFHYSSMAFDVLGGVIAKVSGSTFEDYIRKNILTPLEMKESSFYYPEVKLANRTTPHVGKPARVSSVYPYNRMHVASGTLNTNVLELSHWAAACLNGGQYRNKRIISETTLSQLFTPTFRAFDSNNLQVGLGWMILTENNTSSYIHLGHDVGYVSSIELLPKNGIGIIILINYDEVDMHSIQEEVKNRILE